jgi:hypothetical protein
LDLQTNDVQNFHIKIIFPTFGLTMHSAKHEIIHCERCRGTFECKANSFTKCQCSTVQLTLNEVQYVSELYDGCLCANCLLEIQQDYRVENGLV